MSAVLKKEMQDNIDIKTYEIDEKTEEIALLKTILLSEYEQYKEIEGKSKKPITEKGKALLKSIKEQNAHYEEKMVEIRKLREEIKELKGAMRNSKAASVTKARSTTRRVSKTGFKILKSKKKSKSSSASTSSSKTPSRSKSSSASKITPAKCTHLDINFVDEWIGKESAKLGKGKGEMYSNRKVPSVDKSLKGYEIVNNAADGSCLIHSFLTAASENYRNLSKVNKATVGLRFRSDVYAELFSDKDRMIIVESDYNRMGGEIMKKLDAAPVEGGYSVLTQPYLKFVGGGHGYLYDKDTENLSKCFNMNIITLVQNGSSVKMENSRYIPRGDEKPYIILYQSGAHYETVYKGAQLVFTNADMLPIIAALDSTRSKAIIEVKNEYAPGKLYSYLNKDGKVQEHPILDVVRGDQIPRQIKFQKKASYVNYNSSIKLPKGFNVGSNVEVSELNKSGKSKTVRRKIEKIIWNESLPIIGVDVTNNSGKKVRVLFENQAKKRAETRRKSKSSSSSSSSNSSSSSSSNSSSSSS